MITRASASPERVESALFAHTPLRETLAVCSGRAVSAAQFAADIRALAPNLPHGRHVLNACGNRYAFAVGFCAALTAGKTTVLPSTHTAEVILRLRAYAPDVYCLTDDAQCRIDLPQFQFSDLHELGGRAEPGGYASNIAPVDDNALAAIVFTSGSTGEPIPHEKRWGDLVRSASAAARRLHLDRMPDACIVATVPSQHMYGLESSVLLALQGGASFSAARPFFPDDIRAALEAVQAPRILVTTPVHLRALLDAGVQLPAVRLLVSATAPLSVDLARRAERVFGAPLIEIYGSTETGQIATRRTAMTERWHLFPGVKLSFSDRGVSAAGGHVPKRTPLNDVIESSGDDGFTLHGRTSDLVNVAGKRSSFGYLNAQLQAIDGVVDGVFFLRSARGEEIAERLAAIVVAPGRSAAELLSALRERIDPVLLPRPLLFTDRLPRNETGKLPQTVLENLACQLITKNCLDA